MKKQKKLISDSEILRIKAESFLINKEVKENIRLSDYESIKLIHELKVHQIELEMQNEELQLAKLKAENASQKYAELYDLAPTGYFTLSKEGKIIELNQCGYQMLGEQLYNPLNSLFGLFISDETKPILNLFLQKIFDTGRKESCDVVLSTNGNLPIYLQLTGILIKNADQCIVNAIDISTRIQFQNELKESEEHNHAIILQTTMDGFYIVDLQGYILEVNNVYCQMSGYSEQELLAMQLSDLDAIDKDIDIRKRIEWIISKGKDRFETQHRRKDGSTFDVEINIHYQTENGGQFVAFLHDITERKLAEENLHKSEDRYKSLFKNNQSVILIIDPDTGEIKDANPSACKFYGWTHAVLISKNISEINSPTKDDLETNLQNSKAKKSNHLFSHHHAANGVTRYVEIYSGPIMFSNSTLLYFIVHDITESKLAQDALFESELKFRKYVDNAPHGIFVANENGEYIEVNSAACEITGYTKDELLSMKLFELIHEESWESSNRHFNQVVNEGYASGEFAFIRKNKSKGYWSLDAVKLSEKVFLGFVVEITKRKQVEDTLNENEILLRKSQAAAHIGNYSADLVLKKWNVSEEIYQIFGIDETYPCTIEGWINRVHPDFRNELIFDLENADINDNHFTHEYKIIRFSDEKECWVQGIGRFEFDNQMKPIRIFGTIQNITKRKERDEKLRKLNDTLNVLSKSRQLILHSTDETDYLKQICNLVIEECGFSFVWIGYANNDEKMSIRPIVGAGFEDGYLETLNLTWSDTPRGNGPTGKAIRTGQMCLCANIDTDPAFKPWRDEALKRGYASSIVFPLTTGDKAFGAITVYSKKVDSLSDAEINLLSELSKDISTGITASRWRSAQQKAEMALKQLIEELETIVNERTSDLLKSHIEIQKAEEKYRTVAENTYDWESWIGPDGNPLYVSPSCKRITGYTVADYMNNPDLILKITYPEDQEQIIKHSLEILKGEVTDCSFDFRIITSKGEIKWIGHNCHPVYNNAGKFIGQRGSNRDITARKNTENVLIDSQKNLRELTHRMDIVAEEERIRISRNIHDELGHLLTALKYDMDELSHNSELTLDLAKIELESMICIIDSLIDSVRKIATDLRPGILDHLGLFPSLEWKIKDFQKRTKICTHLKLEETEITFDKNETIIIYRILQEILTNITRHSKASKLWVKSRMENSQFVLSVTDDGIGFNMDDTLYRNSLGLLGMHERALSIGGEIQIESSTGKGTTVSFFQHRN